ncbi:hypothetical protein NFC81_01770 [Salinispirillum sp. LH 10-3-1]|uniref:Uncharacterized protein n=1 Tax=Salinispirillum sp. LH 10-3-1 TaxID=2952525 RepID=A0AB38YGV3_9GAMM
MTSTRNVRVFPAIVLFGSALVLSGCLPSDNKSDVALEPLLPLKAGTFSSHEDVLLLMPTSLYDRTYAGLHTLIALPNIEPEFTTCDSGSVDSQRITHNRPTSYAGSEVLFDIGKSWLKNCLNYGNDAIFGDSEMHGYREIGYAQNSDGITYYGYEISGENNKPFIARTDFFSHQRFYDGDIEVIVERHDDAEDDVQGRVKLYDLTQFASHGTVFHSQMGKPGEPLEFRYVHTTNPDSGEYEIEESYNGYVGAVFRRTKSSPICNYGLIHAKTLDDIHSQEWFDDEDMDMVMTREIISGSLLLTDAENKTADVVFADGNITVTLNGADRVYSYSEYADLVMDKCLGF